MANEGLANMAEAMGFAAHDGDPRSVMAWGLAIASKCCEILTDRETGARFCAGVLKTFNDVVSRHDSATPHPVTLRDLFEAADLDALDVDGKRWLALCELYQTIRSPEYAAGQRRARDIAERRMSQLGIVDAGEVKHILWSRLVHRAGRLHEIALAVDMDRIADDDGGAK